MTGSLNIPRVGAEDIYAIVDEYFQFWPNQEDRRWFWLLWRCLDEQGATQYKDEQGELRVLGLVPAAALFYNECLGESWINESRCGFSEQQMASLAQDVGPQIDALNLQLETVASAMIKALGAEEAIVETWESLKFGQLGYAVSTEERYTSYRAILRVVNDPDHQLDGCSNLFIRKTLEVATLSWVDTNTLLLGMD